MTQRGVQSGTDSDRAAPAWYHAVRPVALAFVVALLLYLAYDVVERVWLQGLDMDQLYGLRRLRGLVAVLIAAGLTGWLILRASPPLFLDPEKAPTERPDVRPAVDERETRYARWFILMRWIAVLAAAVLVFGAINVMGYLPARLWRPLALAIAGLAALNAWYTLALRAGWPSRTLLLAQAYGDLVALTVLLHFSGGVENPLGTLMLFHVIIAGIVLSRQQCYMVAAVAAGLFALLAWAEWSDTLDHYMLSVFPHEPTATGHLHAAHDTDYVLSRVGLQVAVLFLTAYFTTTVTAQLRRGERQLERFADEALAQRQLLVRSLDTTGTALRVRDRELRPTWANPRWQALFDASEDGSEPVRQDADELARLTLADGRARVVEIDLPRPGEDRPGTGADRRTFLLTTAPLLDKEDRTTHVVELAREVTELKQTRLRAARAEKLAAVGELAGKVAHEVNNPNAIISGKARLLLSDHAGELSFRSAEELGKIAELSDRVARIVQGLLSYTRPSHATPAPVDIRMLAERAMAMVEPRVGQSGVQLEKDLPGDLPEVYVNAEEMERVFHNLLLNALDAMPEGGRLSVSATREAGADDGAGHLAVVVADTGTGIPADLQEKVLEPFFTTKPEGKGTGLGLPVCIGLVRSNGGTIDLESEPGQGTRVTVRLPLHRTTQREAHG